MGDDELPRTKWIGLSVVGLLLLLLIPNITGSEILYISQEIRNVSQETSDISEPLPISSLQKVNTEDKIDHLITKYALIYMVDEELARDIIRCESNFNQDALNTKAVIGEDVGLFQFNSHYWQEHMANKGWDIYDTEDNIQAGMWLLKQGSEPWKASRFCWN